MEYEFDWHAIAYPELWLKALSITLLYSVGTIAGGLLLGVLLGTIALSKRKILSAPISFFVQFFRCTPLMIQVVWFYYALPIMTGFTMSSWVAAGLGLTLYMAAFSAEIFRGGVISIEQGQWNASKALGMSHLQMMRHIILPQATRRMIPPFVNQSILQMKNTSLLYVVAVPDLMYTSYELTARTYRPLETYTFVALIYFAILYPATVFCKRLETRIQR